MSKESTRTSVNSTFGEKALDHALFYEYEGSLRFELSEGGSFAEMFTQAYSKASEILDTAFGDLEGMYACLAYYGGKSFLSSLSVFRGIRNCQISIPNPGYEAWQTLESEENELRTYVVFPITHAEIPKLLWSALASDLGVQPKVNCDVYFFNLDLGILAHPYDDRGMDIIGPNKAILHSLYQKHHNHLLEYDLASMERHYGYANK